MRQTPNRQKEESAMSIKYHEIYLKQKDISWLRERVVTFAERNGIKSASKEFQCSKTTVKKWCKRKNDPESIRYKNYSRRPKNIPNQTRPEIEKEVIACWEREHMGGRNLKHQYNLPVTEITAYRILKRNNKVNTRKRKYKQTKDLRKYKAQKKCFEVAQVDAKALYDIHNYYPFYTQLNLPRWEFTFTCEKSGATFYAYAKSEDSLALCTFTTYCLEHLKRYGIKVKRIKTDNKSTAIASRSLDLTNFQKLLKNFYHIEHYPIYHKNQNADVERFHGLIEQYFYSIASFKDKPDFFKQARDKQIWFNFIRKNSGKNWQTPLDIFKKDFPKTDPQVLALYPIDLNKHSNIYFYKVDPTYIPLTKELFFQDVEPEHYAQLISDYFDDDYEYFCGDASKSRWLRPRSQLSSIPSSSIKGGQHVLKLDVINIYIYIYK